jgi:hypothetical protein
MTAKFQNLLGTDHLGTIAIGMITNSLAPSTYANNDNAVRQFFTFCGT